MTDNKQKAKINPKNKEKDSIILCRKTIIFYLNTWPWETMKPTENTGGEKMRKSPNRHLHTRPVLFLPEVRRFFLFDRIGATPLLGLIGSDIQAENLLSPGFLKDSQKPRIEKLPSLCQIH